MKLTKKDYNDILIFYKIPFKKNTKFLTIKNKAEAIISKKLCKCINKNNNNNNTNNTNINTNNNNTNNNTNNKNNKNKSIKICINSVVNKKGFKLKTFSCKKTKKIKLNKKT